MSNTTEQDEDLAFEQAFNATHAELTEQAPTTEKVEAPAPSDTAAPATAPAAVATPEANAQPEADPYASLPPAVRELLARVPALEARLEQTTRVANMVPALQSRLDKLSQPAPATEQVPGKSRFAKVEAIRHELPEIADALDEIANATTRTTEPQRQATPTPQQPTQAQESQAERALSAVRPQWANELTSSDFTLWLDRQEQGFKQRVKGTDDAGDILEALGRFDQYRAQTNNHRQLNQTRTTRMAAAVTPQGDGRRQRAQVQPEDEEEAAFAAAFNKARGR